MTAEKYIIDDVQLMKEWDYGKNTDLGFDPNVLTSSSHQKVWWKCSRGHQWEAIISNRSKGAGCPVCAGKIVLSGFNDLKTVVPKLSKQWHPTKNGSLTPLKISAGSGKKVWWMDEYGHEWKAAPCDRLHGRGCPICAGRKILIGFNDLVTTAPNLIAEWDYAKNNFLPTEVTKGSNKLVWWKCQHGHSWSEQVVSRTNKGLGCPICSGKRVLSGYNDLQTTYPNIAKEWHPTKNSNLLPTQVTFGSDKVAWWICQYGHEWSSPIQQRTRGSGCPICAKGLRVSFPEKAVFFYLKKVCPDAIENYHSEWLGRSEIDIFIPSKATGIEYDGRQFHRDSDADEEKNLLCEKNKVRLIRIREKGCPELPQKYNFYCLRNRSFQELESAIKYIFKELDISNQNIQIDIANDKANIYEFIGFSHKNNSLLLMAPSISEEWHPSKNGVLTADMVSPYSDRRVWWMGKCGHEWEDTVAHRYTGRKCPICSGRKVLTGFNDLETTFPDIAEEWHPTKNATLTPKSVTKGSNRKVWWLGKCGHEWEAVISSRANGIGCPICAGRKPIRGVNDLATAYPEIAQQWSKTLNKNLSPCDVVPGSSRRIWWKCPVCGYEYQKTIRQKVKVSRCPKCQE